MGRIIQERERREKEQREVEAERRKRATNKQFERK